MGNSQSSNPTRRYTVRGVKTREKLVEALLEIVSSEGMQAASVRKITGKAGCNEAILYQHFKNKDEMLREVFAEIMAEMADEKEGLVEEHPLLDDAIRRWVETTFSYYDRNSDAFAYVLLASPPVVRSPSPLYGRMTKLFGELLSGGKAVPADLADVHTFTCSHLRLFTPSPVHTSRRCRQTFRMARHRCYRVRSAWASVHTSVRTSVHTSRHARDPSAVVRRGLARSYNGMLTLSENGMLTLGHPGLASQ